MFSLLENLLNEHKCVQEPTHNFAEEFGRMVSEAANQPSASESASKSNFVCKPVEVPVTTASAIQTHTNPISTVNNIAKSEILNVNENIKSVANEIIECNETPVVSAISDSPVVVPKISLSVKQLQKNSEQSQPLDVDDKNLPSNKEQKQNKSKPHVPQDETEKQSEVVSPVVPLNTLNTQAVVTASECATVAVTATTSVPTAATATTTSTTASVTPIPSSLPTPTPQPQRIREPRERVRSEDKEKLPTKPKEPEKETPELNGPTTVGEYSFVPLI